MNDLQPLSSSKHSQYRWRRFKDFSFARNVHLAPIATAELSRAAIALPLAFVNQNGKWSLCTLLGLEPRSNLYVTPDNQWIAAYVPAYFRSYPFQLGWHNGTASLCIDLSSDLITEDLSNEPIFADDGNLSPAVQSVWNFLEQAAESLVAMERVVNFLAEAGVIEPWPITLHGPEGPRFVSGLYRINEAALNNLDQITFLKIRAAGALPVAYTQLISMINIADLGKLAQARAEFEAKISAEAARQANAEPLLHLPNDSTIDWDWSKVGR